MPRFTKDEMLDELRTIFLYEADHLIHGAGHEMAVYFIGFESEDGEYLHLNPACVDLGRFSIPPYFERAYEYAFNPSPLNKLSGDEMQDLIVFMQGTPRAGGVSSGGEMHPFMTPDGKCQTVVDAAWARMTIDEESGGLTVRELALLADMTEGAVRNALSAGDGGLTAIKGSKPAMVELDIALSWLKTRRGYRATPVSAGEDPALAARLRTASEFGQLSSALWTHVEASKTVMKDVRAKYGVSNAREFDAELRKLDARKLKTMAEDFGLDGPYVAGRIIELALRDSDG